MITSREVVFSAGTVLTGEMLQETYNFPRDFTLGQYRRYGNGILNGFDYYENNGKTYVSKGTIKIEDKFFFLREDICLTDFISELAEKKQYEANRFYIGLKITGNIKENKAVFSNELKWDLTNDKTQLDIVLGQAYSRNADDIKLPNGTITDSQNPKNNQLVKVNYYGLLDVPQSCLAGNTFVPYVFNFVREYLEIKQEKSFDDLSLLFQLQSNGVVPLATLKSYISSRGGDLPITDDRKELFSAFLREIIKPGCMKLIINSPKIEQKIKVERSYRGPGGSI